MAGKWALNGGSSATYTKDGGDYSVTITGLSSNVALASLSALAVTDPSKNAAGVIKLSDAVFDTTNTAGASVAITNITGGGNYVLSLSGVNTTNVAYDSASKAVLTAVTGGSLKIQTEHSAGWTGLGTTKLTYTAAGANTDLATITGFWNGHATTTGTANIALSGTNLFVMSSALSTAGTVGFVGDANGFSLSLATSTTVAENDNKIENGDVKYKSRWVDDGLYDVYNISDGTKAFWHVEDNQIKYNEGGTSTVMKLSGLNASLTADKLNSDSSPIKLTNKIFSVSAAALEGTNSFSILNTSLSYGLSLASNVALWSQDTILADASIASAGEAYIQQVETKGWKVDAAGSTYNLTQSAAAKTLATISGLSKAAKYNLAGISLASASATVITLGVSAFDTVKTGNVVSIVNNPKGDGTGSYYNYSLSLATKQDNLYSASSGTVGLRFESVTGGSTAFIVRTPVSGYTANTVTTEGGNAASIGYVVGQEIKLASIEGLSTTLATGNVTLAGASITLAEGALNKGGKAVITDLVNERTAGYSSADVTYTLALKGGLSTYDAKGVISLDATGITGGSSAILKNFHSAGWILTGNSSISYSSDTTDTLAKITGLSTGAKINAAGLSFSTAAGQSHYITLGVSAFATADKTKRTVSIVDDFDDGITYSLSLATGLEGEIGLGGKLKGNAYLSIASATGGASATVIQGLSAGYSILSSSTAITYTAASSIELARITGLSNAALSSGANQNVTLNAADSAITFGVGALSTSNDKVRIVDLYNEGSNSWAYGKDHIDVKYTIGLSNAFTVAAKNLYDVAGVVGLSGISAGTAYVVNTHAAGWSVASASEINYYGQSVVRLATITGLSATGVTISNAGLSLASGSTVVMIGKSALNSSNSAVRIADEFDESGGDSTLKNTSYTIKLNLDTTKGGFSAKDDLYDTTGVKGLSFAGIAGGSAAVVNTHAAGWSQASVSAIDYKATFVDTLATINGLSNTANLGTRVGLSVGTNLISLKWNALTNKSVTLVNHSSAIDGQQNYSLSLAGDDVSVEGAKTYIGFDKTENNYWSIRNNTTAVYQFDTNEGWSLSGGKSTIITYKEKETTELARITSLTNLATITGANGAVGISGITVSGDSIGAYSGTITLNKNVLSQTNMALITGNGASYGLSLGADVSAAGAIEAAEIGVNSNNKRVIDATLAGGYDIVSPDKNNTSYEGIRYTASKKYTVATITGLNKSTLPEGSVSINIKDNVITLGTSALTNTAVTLVNNTLESGYAGGYSTGAVGGESYKFTLAMAGGGSTLGFTDGKDHWVVDKSEADGTAAVLQYKTSEGWTLGSNSTSIAYTGESANTIVRITNLNTNIVAVSGAISGINVVAHVNDNPLTQADESASGAITLDKSVLGTSSTAVTYFTVASFSGGNLNNKAMYSIDINKDSLDAEYVPTVKSNDVQRWTFTRNGATFSTYDTEYWTLGSNSITYSGESDVRAHAIFKGLVTTAPSAAVLAGAISIAYTDTAQNSSHSGGTIYLGSGVLNKANVSMSSVKDNFFTVAALSTGSYAVSAPTLTNAKWELTTPTTATYKGKITEGYEATKDNTQLIYSASSTNASVASVTGLKQGLVVGTSGAWIGVGEAGASTVTKGLTLSAATRVITLGKDVLGTSDLKVTGTNYTLSLATANLSSSTAIDVWRVSGTSAIFKNVTPTYYKLAADKLSITTTAEKDTKNGTIVTINNLKSGLKVDDDNNIAGISLSNASAKGILTLTEDVLDADKDKIVTFTKGGFAHSVGSTALTSYSLSAASSVAVPTAEDNLTWKVSSGTATRVGTMNAGWTVRNNGASIVYTAKDNAFTFATVKGLKSDVAAAVLNSSTGLTLGSKSATVTALNLTTAVLGGTSVTVSGSSDVRATTNYGGYSLVLNTSDSASYNGLRSKATDATIWAADTVNGTTYTYKGVTLNYYSLGAGAKPTVASYVAQKDVSGKNYATFTNLAKGLVDASAPSTIAGVSVIGNAITFNEVSRADTSSNVSVGTIATGYSVKLNDNIKPKDDGKSYWVTKVDNSLTTATYQSDVTGGYSYIAGGKSGIYYIDDYKNERAKLAGLREGLTLNKGGSSIDGITINTANSTIGLTRDVLALSNVTLTGSDKYSITAIEDATVGNTTAWKGTDKNSTSAVLIGYTPAKYETVSGGKGVTYTAAKDGSAIATVSGLKKGTLIVDPYADGQIAGISVGSKTVTLSSGVLDKKNVTLVNASTVAGSMYSLTLDGSSKDSVAGPSGVWQWEFNKSKNTATYNYSIVGGYAVGSTSTATPKNDLIVYTPTKTLKTTITNLKPTVTVSSGANNSIGIENGNDYTGITGYGDLTVVQGFSATDTTSTISGTITLSNEVLNQKNVTISSNNAKVGSFLLGLNEDDRAQVTGIGWNKNSTTTAVATYEQTTAAGYTLADDSKSITYSSTPTAKVLATLTGLKKTVLAQGGNIEGIEVENAIYANVDESIGANTPGTITILNTDVLGNSNLTLGKTDNFNLSLANVSTSVAVSLGTANYSRDTLSKWTNTIAKAAALSFAVKYANPTWTYNASKGTAALNVGTTEGWALTQTAGAGTSTTDDDAYKTITYTAAKVVNIANITGLAKNLSESAFAAGVSVAKPDKSAFTSYEAAGNSGAALSGVVSISKAVLTNANLKIAEVKAQADKYDFTLSINADDLAAKDEARLWSVAVDKKGSLTGTATYQYGTSEGWTLNSGSGTNNLKDTLTYSAAKTTTLATLTNLNKSSAILKDVVKGVATGKATTVSVSSIEGLTVGAARGLSGGGSAVTITVKDIDLFGKNKVTLTNGKNTGIAYSLSLGDDVASKSTANAWSIASNGTVAYYKNMRTAGYTLNGTSTVATYNELSATNTLFTLKGLKKGNKVEDIVAGIDVAGNNVYVHDAVTGTTNITLTQGKVAADSTSATKYQFATDYISTPTLSAPLFNAKTGGTVTLTQVTSAGFTLGANGKQGDNTLLKYSKLKTTTLATIKGLNATTETVQENGKNVKKPLLTVGSDSSSGTPVSVVGLKTTLASGAVSYPTVLTYDDEINTITVKKDALIAKNVTITSQKTDPYTLVIGDNVPTYAEETTEWVVSGTTGSYKTYDKAFYTYKQDKNGKNTTIAYTKPTAGTTYAKVTNLLNTASLSAGSVSTAGYDFVTKAGAAVSGDTGGVLTLEKAKLTANKSVALTGNDGYILQLGDDFTGNISSLGSAQWTASKGTVTAKATRTAGYELAFGMKSVTYNKTSKSNQVVAKLTGLATTVGTNAIQPDSSNNVITLNDAQLAKKNVVLSTSQGDVDYKLAFGTVSAPVITETNQTIKNGTLTLTGEVTQAGYVLGSSSTAITYVKASASKTNKTTGDVTYTPYTLATFKGVEDTTSLTVSDNGLEVTIKGSNLQSKSTITPGALKVTIDGTFKDKAITGSANADSFVLSGNETNVTVNPGKGNDYVDFGEGNSGNVFVYANGSGNDVVEHFDLSNDKFQLTSGTMAFEKDGTDVVIKVGSGNVRLVDAWGSSSDDAFKQLNVLNAKGQESPYTIYPNSHVFKTSSSGLIEDDNFSTDAALSEIVKGDQGSPTDVNINTMGTMGTMGTGSNPEKEAFMGFVAPDKK